MKYAFIKDRRSVFSTRAMCRMFRVHHSGFYAWLKAPLSKRAKDDGRLIELIKQAWQESGCVYGYRKIHDDLRSAGETCCPNRVARLAKMAGIKAQVGYRKKPGSYGGKPAIVADNQLKQDFDSPSPDQVWVTDITYIRTHEGWLSGVANQLHGLLFMLIKGLSLPVMSGSLSSKHTIWKLA